MRREQRLQAFEVGARQSLRIEHEMQRLPERDNGLIGSQHGVAQEFRLLFLAR